MRRTQAVYTASALHHPGRSPGPAFQLSSFPINVSYDQLSTECGGSEARFGKGLPRFGDRLLYHTLCTVQLYHTLCTVHCSSYFKDAVSTYW